MNKHFKRFMTVISFASVAMIGFVGCDTGSGEAGTHKHTYDTKTWVYDDEGNYHWHPATCEHTDQQNKRAKHTFKEELLDEIDCTTGGSMKRTCETCGYSDVIEAAPLGHDTYQVPMQLPGCETDGHTAYIACTRCDYISGYKVLLKTGEHFFSPEWQFDTESHWHPSTCGCNRLSSEKKHTLNGDGVCTECGYDSNKALPIDYLFESDGSNGYIIAGLTELGKSKTTLEVPANYGSRAITGIKDFAFEGEEGIVEIVLPDSITTIGREVFNGCENLEKVTLGKRVTSIGYAAFLNCSALEEITLPASVKTIKPYAFEGCSSLKALALPAALTELGEQAFGGCSALAAITIPEGITTIANNMFQGCSALATVTFEGAVTKIGDNAFARCTALKTIDLGNALKHIGQSAFRASGLTELTVPTSVTTISVSAFAECASLKKATIEASVDYIYGSLFSGCGALEEITLPFVGSHATVTDKTLSTAFGFIFGTSVSAAAADKFEKVGGKYYVPKSLKKVTVLGGTISEGAFDGCSMLEKIYYASGVTVSATTFEGCTATLEQLP